MTNRVWQNPNLPLSEAEKTLTEDGTQVLPSSEANFFSVLQDQINRPYIVSESSVIETYPEAEWSVNAAETGIFHYSGQTGKFSGTGPAASGIGDRLKPFRRPPLTNSTSAVNIRGFSDFRIQDSYIHHKPFNGAHIEIDFLSSYGFAIEYNRYGNFDSYYNAGFGGGQSEDE